MARGGIIFAVSAFALWLIARGYAKNLPNAINTLIGASTQQQQAPAAPQAPTSQAPGTTQTFPLSQLAYEAPIQYSVAA